jgi:hypothetical protein
MVALGASVTAAVAMADNISAATGGRARIAARHQDDVYGDDDDDDDDNGVTQLPETGVGGAQDSSSMAKPALAAGAAAAALVALRMRQPKTGENEA